MKEYKLKNFLGLTRGILKEFIEVENGMNIDFVILESSMVLLGYSPDSKQPKKLKDLQNELEKLVRDDKDILDYDVMLVNTVTEEISSIEMIDPLENKIILGKNKTEDKKIEPKDEWFYSPTHQILKYVNNEFTIVINKETIGKEDLGYCIASFSNNNDVSKNKLTYFTSVNALSNRFNFNKYGAEKISDTILESLEF